MFSIDIPNIFTLGELLLFLSRIRKYLSTYIFWQLIVYLEHQIAARCVWYGVVDV